MSTTTQILFNSPALHSLKRDQLVKLCKLHSIKAIGKNTELVDKLKKHAETLPIDSPLRIALMDEGSALTDQKSGECQTENDSLRQSQRTSEQWELLDSIEELDETSSMNTLTSRKTMSSKSSVSHEYGSQRSRTTSVSSSIKALASTLGLQRATSVKSTHSVNSAFSFPSLHPISDDEDQLRQNSVPYSELPPAEPDTLPQTDHFKFSTPDSTICGASRFAPLPGQFGFTGQPVPENASLGVNDSDGGPKRTIRLVTGPTVYAMDFVGKTPVLKPWKTNFDLVGDDGRQNWPPSPGMKDSDEGLYPSLPVAAEKPTESDDEGMAMPGAMPVTSSQPIFTDEPPAEVVPASTQVPATPATLKPAPGPSPFIFGSPLPAPAFTFKSAAASVLEEMNKRLGIKGVQSVGTDMLQRLGNGGKSRTDTNPTDVEKTPRAGDKERQKFDRLHQEEFAKMPSIVDHYAARRGDPGKGVKRKSIAVEDHPPADASGAGRVERQSLGKKSASRSGQRATVISNGVRKKMDMPGALDCGVEDAEGNRRMSKRPRIEANIAQSQEQNEAEKVVNKPIPGSTESDEQRAKEREAIKRKLEISKARRRSSRVSVGKVVENQKKPTNTRFAFLNSAKSVVRSVWKGVSSTAPKPANVIASAVQRGDKSKTNKAELQKTTRLPIATPQTVVKIDGAGRDGSSRSLLVSEPHVATAKSSLKPSGTDSGIAKTAPSAAMSAAARSKSPIPPSASAIARTRVNSNSTLSSSGSASSRLSSRNNSIAGASSIGTKTSSGSKVSPMGSKTSWNRASEVGSGQRTIKGQTALPTKAEPRARTSSRLLAPTASSLAKVQSKSSGNINDEVAVTLAAVGEERANLPLKSKAPLGQITNGSVANQERNISPALDGTGTILDKPLEDVNKPLVPLPDLESAENKPPAGSARGRLMLAKKPRISRSKVIAKLVSQRAASSVPSEKGARNRTGIRSSRPRSSIGTAVAGGIKAGRVSAGGGALLSAKKRARQSEYARRKSGVALAVENRRMTVNEA